MDDQDNLVISWDTQFLESAGYIVTKHRAGYQARKYFPNGFGVSIIPEMNYLKPDYPALEGVYELAVLSHRGDGVGSTLCYDSGITDDVLRFLTLEQVVETASRVESLPCTID